jgi:putative oxidoreductase
MRTNKWLLGAGATPSPPTEAGLAVLRITAGLLLALLHGIGKVPPQEGFVG